MSHPRELKRPRRTKGTEAVSTSGITSTLLSQIASSSSTANQFTTDLNQLAQDLQSGSLSAAQDDFVTLSQDALNGVTSSTDSTSAGGITPSLLAALASSSSSSSSFVGELNQLGTDLQNGDLSSAQEDMLSLDSTALNAASAASTNTSSTSSTAATSSPSDVKALIQAIVQAMSSGDSSSAGAAMQELAAVSPSSAGASYLQTISESLTASSSSSSSNPVSQALQGLDTSGLNSSSSALNLLA
jgi:hypothetical protein